MEVHGLVNLPKYNGFIGVVVAGKVSPGRVCVKFDDEPNYKAFNHKKLSVLKDRVKNKICLVFCFFFLAILHCLFSSSGAHAPNGAREGVGYI